MDKAYDLQGFDFMVSTRCLTYNQENYIEDAMAGFAMQKTNFPHVAIIIDDASTDHNADVIRNFMNCNFDMEDESTAYIEHNDYGDVWFARHKTIHNCFFAAVFLKENHYQNKKPKGQYFLRWQDKSKYIAACEGDDYWIDYNKLQRQVNFLESHPDCDLVFHNALMRFQDQDRPDRVMREFETGFFTTAQIFEKWQLPLASVVFRKDLLNCDEIKQLQKVCGGGFLYFLAASMRNKAYGISECWSVYRKNKGGVSNNFTPAIIQNAELGLAYATGDSATKKIMDQKAVKYLERHIASYLRKEKDAVELVKVTDSYNKKIYRKALRNYIFHIPSKLWGKITKTFRKKHQ